MNPSQRYIWAVFCSIWRVMWLGVSYRLESDLRYGLDRGALRRMWSMEEWERAAHHTIGGQRGVIVYRRSEYSCTQCQGEIDA